jgi:hypothetical protein
LLPLADPKPASALWAVCVANLAQPAAAKSSASSQVASRNTSIQRSGSIVNVAVFGRIGAADQRLRQAVRVVRVVEAVAALDAQPAHGWPGRRALRRDDAVVLDVVGELAAHAAERAHRIDLLVGHRQRRAAPRNQRAGRAGLHTLAAGHAGGRTHRVVHVEDDLRVRAAKGQADDVVDLFVTAGAQAAGALDAGVQVDGDRRVRQSGTACVRCFKTRRGLRRPACSAHWSVRRGACSAVSGMSASSSSSTSFCDFCARSLLVVTFMPARVCGSTTAPSTRSPAISTTQARQLPAGVQAGLVAQVRDLDPFAPRDLDQRLVDAAHDLAAVELEQHLWWIELRGFAASDGVHGASLVDHSSCGKYLITQSTGLGAAWPRPQMEASRITVDRSASRSRSHFGCSISAEALAVPLRQGVH